MIDSATEKRLHDCIRRESRSLLQYSGEVPFWAAAADRVVFDRLREMAQAEKQSTDTLAVWLQRNRAGILHLGPYPSGFLSFNDSGIRQMMPRIIVEHEQLLARLEADTAAIDVPEVMPLLNAMTDRKKLNRAVLKSLLSPAPSC